MRFVHTSDWQIGMKAAHVGGAGRKVREERLAAAGRVVEAAKDFGAEFILVAGDTFENNGVDRIYVQKVADILSGFGVPVFIIPGNHDPFCPGSVWEHPSWGGAQGISVLTAEEPVEIPGGLLFPCPITDRYSSRDPTGWIDTSGCSGLKIGVAHGNVEGINPEDHYHPVPVDAAKRHGLDYLALGHWHSYLPFETGGSVRMAYSGTHEPTRFGERESGQVLLVEIDLGGQGPSIQVKKTGRLKWLSLEERIIQQGELTGVRERIESMTRPEEKLIHLTLSGILHLDESEELPRIEEIIASRFLYGRMETGGLRPLPDDSQLLAALPAGIIRDSASRLLELSDPSYAGERPTDGTPEVAALAFLELYSMAREVGA